MLRTYWLLFAQGATLLLAAAFVLATLRPEWLPVGLRTPTQSPTQSPTGAAGPGLAERPASLPPIQRPPSGSADAGGAPASRGEPPRAPPPPIM